MCLGHVVPELPNLSLGSLSRSGMEIDLADVIEPLQNYLLTSSGDRNIFSSAEYFSSCAELLAEFGDKALQPSYDPWSSVDSHGRAKIHADLTKTYNCGLLPMLRRTLTEFYLLGVQKNSCHRTSIRHRDRALICARLLLRKLLFRNSVLLVLALAGMPVVSNYIDNFECCNSVSFS